MQQIATQNAHQAAPYTPPAQPAAPQAAGRRRALRPSRPHIPNLRASRSSRFNPAPGRTASSACYCDTAELPAAAGGDKPPHRQPNRPRERHGHGRCRADLRELHYRRFEPFGLFDGRIGGGIAGKSTLNPLFIYGKSGLGKTPLATSYPELHSGNAARYARGVYRRAGIHHGIFHRRD